MHFRSLRCHGFITFGRFSPSSVSAQQRLAILLMSCICGTPPRLGCCRRQRRSDRLLLRSSNISEVRLVLASHVPHDGMRVHPLWVRSFLTRCGSALFRSSSLWCSLKLLATSRCFRLFAAPCTAFSWRSMSCFVANCSLVYSMLTHALRAVRWTDQHGVRLHPRRHPVLANGLCMDVIVLRGPLRSPSVHPAKAESSAVALSAAAAAAATCLMVSGHFSTQTCLYGSTCQHIWWSLALVIDASSALCGPHGQPREPQHGSSSRPVSQFWHLFVSGILVCIWVIGLGLPHLRHAHDSASLATACSPFTTRLVES